MRRKITVLTLVLALSSCRWYSSALVLPAWDLLYFRQYWDRCRSAAARNCYTMSLSDMMDTIVKSQTPTGLMIGVKIPKRLRFGAIEETCRSATVRKNLSYKRTHGRRRPPSLFR